MWVFAYGSLIWDPGFAAAEVRPATLHGWHRSFCMWSVRYRGTAAVPGLVLALDRAEGASCRGLALRVPDDETEAVHHALRARELVSSAYTEVTLPVETDRGTVPALTFVIDRGHPQYCTLPRAAQAAVIARAHGARGPNRDYLFATAQHLADLGLADPDLDWLAAEVRGLPG